MKTYDKTNYFEDSQGVFDLCYPPTKEPDYISYKKSFVDYNRFLDKNNLEEEDLSFEDFKNLKPKYLEVSSVYWYEDEYLYRQSDHWGEVSSCNWELRYSEDCNKTYCARIKFSDLKKNSHATLVDWVRIEETHVESFFSFERYIKSVFYYMAKKDNKEPFNEFLKSRILLYKAAYGVEPKNIKVKELEERYKSINN